jgi:GntR family transcriptional regulator
VFEKIDSRSPTPLYAQIASRIRAAIAAGELVEGQSLPSVRQLAATLRINPATAVQAYRELEVSGFVERKHGAGTFVLGMPEPQKKTERTRQAERLVRELLDEAARLGINGDDLQSVLDREMGKENHD